MKVIDLRTESLPPLSTQLRAKNSASLQVFSEVQHIIDTVKAEGDFALKAFTRQWDCPLDLELKVPKEDILGAEKLVSESLKAIIQKAVENITAFHEHQKIDSWQYTPSQGVLMGQRICPLSRVGLYIPGGKASYPSTLLMNAIPALLAGVKDIVIFTPRDSEGQLNPLVLYAADCLGLYHIYAIGGAQAVAAAAYGTESIAPVDKLVGPGNKYVTAAKKLVFGDIAIDMIAGPSEVLIIADQKAPVSYIAADLLAQAEHDADAGLYVCTTDPHLPIRLASELDKQLQSLPKAVIAKQALESLQVFICAGIDDAIKISNQIAPEHLELLLEAPLTYLDRIESAGSVFLGPYTPEALGDYMAGPNHTLPTSSTARFSSPLGVYDFIKRPSFLMYDKAACIAISDAVSEFALAENLEAHSRAIQIRKE